MQNKDVYNSKNVVEKYKKNDYLTSAEHKIISILLEKKDKGNMLDIGVGTGRTTKYFAPLFENYFGIDFADLMVEACKMKYSQMNCQFTIGDARSLVDFNANFFDVVLFSFNGVDCISTYERISVIKEVYRVLKKDGLFAFSIHNLYNIPKLFSVQLPRNPFKLGKAFRRKRLVKHYNPSMEKLMSADFVDVIDGDLNFSTSYVYSNPSAQIKQLESMNFSIDEIISMKGKLLDRKNVDWSNVDDAWLYFVCSK